MKLNFSRRMELIRVHRAPSGIVPTFTVHFGAPHPSLISSFHLSFSHFPHIVRKTRRVFLRLQKLASLNRFIFDTFFSQLQQPPATSLPLPTWLRLPRPSFVFIWKIIRGFRSFRRLFAINKNKNFSPPFRVKEKLITPFHNRVQFA